ncbi:hypothetical protein ABIC28_005097 [Rhodococcus sp. PvR044]|uniref:hypothetical protein n=1 Tax=Rhodococcus sp. PvR044 TaxID=3156402 RepID=UPI00339166B4
MHHNRTERRPGIGHRSRRSAAVLAIAAAALLTTSACSAVYGDPAREEGPKVIEVRGDAPPIVSAHTVTLPDGAQVLCIWEANNALQQSGGGVSCDWANKTAATVPPMTVPSITLPPHP